ncbi:MAG: hypothetical protein KGL45_05825 [Gammaproteobacteria bacterium]|nr:hypothetical protein [Gammaproteobacteria bacterium]MDE2262021.1 hypothetical protein [Gammaproteobacteria bacterium]
MNDPALSKIRRLGDLPRDIPPPHDGWPALEAMLRESSMPQAQASVEQRGGAKPARHWRPRTMHVAMLAAILAAVVVGISIDRWILSPAPLPPPVAAAHSGGSAAEAVPVSFLTDPRYLRERAALLRSLNSRLAKLPPPTRKKVLNSLGAIEQSMRDIQQALGREPGNALLQELLIDTCQNEMQLLTTVAEASGGSGET